MLKFKARSRGAVALATVGVLLAGCGGSSSEESQSSGTLNVGMVGSVSCLGNVNCPGALEVNGNALEPLQVVGPDKKVHPWLAESVERPNATTYVYRLRKDVKFWNDAEMTSADVVASLKFHRRTAAYQFVGVKSITASDPKTVTIKLEQPDAGWPYRVANFAMWVTEKKFLDAHRANFGKPGTLVMGTGPWSFKSLDPTSGAELVANPRYWGAKAPFERLAFKFFSDESSAALALRAGAIDMAVPASPGSFSDTAGLSSPGSRARLVRVESPNVYAFSMNTQVSPWNDVHVRRAVAYALNPVDLAKSNGGFGTVVPTFYSPQLLESLVPRAQVDEALRQVPTYRYDVAKAKAELAKSAHPNGFSTTLKTYQFGNWPQANQAIAAQLKAIGIDAQVKTISQSAWFAEIVSGPTSRPPVFNQWGVASPDPSSLNYAVGTANVAPGLYNTASWKSPEADALIAQSVATSDPSKRLAAYVKLQQLMAKDVPYVPLFTQQQTLALSKKLTWSTYDPFYYSRPWALEIKDAPQ